MDKRLLVALTFTLCPVVGWTAGAWHASVSHRTPATYAVESGEPARPEAPPSSWLALPTPLIDEVPNDDRRDLYGNDVSPAIARYTHDAAGAVREEHSPATEVARLKPPVT